MERHIAELRSGFAKAALKVGERAPAIVNARGEAVDVSQLLKRGPVVVTFYRGGWCPFCNLELRAFQRILPDIKAVGAALVAISPEKPDDTLSTSQKNALRFEVLSDVGQKVGRAFGLFYAFSDELKSAYLGFGLDIPERMAWLVNGRYRFRRPMPSIATAQSSTPTRMQITATVPTQMISSGFSGKGPPLDC